MFTSWLRCGFDEALGILPSSAGVALRGSRFAQHQVALGAAPSTVVPLVTGALLFLHALLFALVIVGGASFPRSLREILAVFVNAKVVE